MTSTLPEGWTVEEETEEDKLKSKLPEGWKVESEPSTPKARDEAKLQKEAGKLAAEDKTPEQIKKMSAAERLEYAQDLNREREYLQSSQFSKGALSGATFGLTENVEALKPIEFEETNPYSLIGTGGHVAGSLVPLSRLIKVFHGPATKLASKSPVFQKQLSSLATMFGVGASEAALTQLAKGEVPTSDEVLEHGLMWTALDAALQVAGVAGRFAKGLLSRAKSTGVGRKELVNQIGGELEAAGVDMTNPEKVASAALEILERPLTEAEQAAATRKLQIAKQPESPVTQIAQATKEQAALEQHAITPKQLKGKKITDEPVNRLTSETRVMSEPYQPESLDFTKEADTLAKDSIQEQIDSVGTRAASEEELGDTIQADIESRLETLKKEYRPLYVEAENASRQISHIPEKTAKEAGEKLVKMSKLKTKPAGYNSVLKHLEDVLEDSGYLIQRGEDKAIELIVSDKPVPVQQSIELGRRLNEIVDYEAVEPSVKDALKSVVKAVKEDIRIGLKQNPDALAAFELAEAEHARVASKFSKDSIRKIRGSDAGEKISKMSESPSTLGDLREVLSPEQMMKVEREMLEKLNNQSYEKAQKQLKEIKRHLSKENQKLAQEIVDAKNPFNPSARKKVTQEAILNDMSTALTNGTRPEKTLNLWKTPKGQKVVKETFNNSPNWPKVKNYLEKQSFDDMVSTVMKDGKVDIKRFKEFMRDPATVNNIRNMGGEEAVTFFRGLDAQVKQLESNVKLLDNLPKKSDVERGKELLRKTKEKAKVKPKVSEVGEEALQTLRMRKKETTGQRGEKLLERMAQKDFPTQAKVKKWREWFTDTMGLNEKGLLSVFGLMKLGLPNTVVSLIGYRMFDKLLTNPRVRRAFLQAASKQNNPLNFIIAVEHLGDVLDE